MPTQFIFWDKAHSKLKENITEDLLNDNEWLERYLPLLTQYKPLNIFDLGCGFGNATLYLLKKKFNVISCDLSGLALEWMHKMLPHSSTFQCDFLNGLPFRSNPFNVIIADSCLHYFSWNETIDIIKELYRILAMSGCILLRVNSTKDKNFGAGQGQQIEMNYYLRDGRLKRFFDEIGLRKLFEEMNIINLREVETSRFGKLKHQWELIGIMEKVSET